MLGDSGRVWSNIAAKELTVQLESMPNQQHGVVFLSQKGQHQIIQRHIGNSSSSNRKQMSNLKLYRKRSHDKNTSIVWTLILSKLPWHFHDWVVMYSIITTLHACMCLCTWEITSSPWPYRKENQVWIRENGFARGSDPHFPLYSHHNDLCGCMRERKKERYMCVCVCLCVRGFPIY